MPRRTAPSRRLPLDAASPPIPGVAALALLMSMAVTLPAWASDVVTVQMKGTQTIEYDSNPLLLLPSQNSLGAATGSITTPEITINGDLPNSHFDDDLRMDFNRYNLDGFSSNDIHDTLNGKVGGELWQASLGGAFDYDTTRTSEITGSGLNVAGIRHTGLSLSPQGQISLSPLDTLQLSGSYSAAFYSDTQRFTDFDDMGLTPTFQHVLDPLNAVQAMVQYSRFFTTSGSQLAVDTLMPMLGWVGTPTPQLKISASAGMQKNIWHFPAGSSGTANSTIGYAFMTDLSYSGVNDILHLNGTRQAYPLASGTLTDRTSFTLDLTHAMTPRFSATMSFTYLTFSYSAPVAGSQSELISAMPSLVFHATSDFDLTASYRFRQKEIVDTPGDATSNTIMLTLTYSPQRRVVY